MTAADDLALADQVALGVARDWLRQRVNDGQHCPCCGQYAKVYRRSIHAEMARTLIAMYRTDTSTTWGWVHLPSLYAKGGDTAKLTYWGLLVEDASARPDGGRAGWWRVTELGRSFVRGIATVPKYARVYDGRCLGLTGPGVSIVDCLGAKFDYADLMAA